MPNFALVDLRNGVRRDVESFLIDNDAFPILENAYLFRGRIERRSCFTPVGTDGRLKWSTLGVTDGLGNFSVTYLDGTFSPGIPSAVASFRISGIIGGQPVSGILTDPGTTSPVQILLKTNTNISGTLTRNTGVFTVSGLDAGSAVTVVYVPGLPVLGLRTREQVAINDELLLSFDLRYSYSFDQGLGEFVGANTFALTTNQFIWTGTDSDQFWSTNYYSAFWATNNTAGYHATQDASPVAERDGIRWYGVVNGAVPPGTSSTGWRNFNPGLNGTTTPLVAATQFLLGGLIILPYKDRLVVLNTLEGANLAGATRFPQRARFSQNGTPFYTDFPVGGSDQLNSWSGVEVGRGGYIDAPTSEVIVSAEFIKDTLIVYFERSTWQLVYTGNETLPFVWQKINTELGSESTFSIVPFDNAVIGIGNYGIISTNSVSVVRIDQKIPDEVFQIQNTSNGVKRVSGIRDYNAQLAYFSYPVRSDEDGEAVTYTLTYPNQVLVYNYLDGSWAEFDDCFTCFGYYQEFTDKTWATLQRPWNQQNTAWNSQVLQARYPDVIAGNQRGFVMIFSQLLNIGQNSPSIPISDINITTRVLTCPDHNFVIGQYVQLTGVLGVNNTATLSDGTTLAVYKIVAATTSKITLDQPTRPPSEPQYLNWTGVYTGGGLITHIPNFTIKTKEFNPWFQDGKSVRLNYMDMFLDRTSDGEITAQFYTSDNNSVPIETETVLTSADSGPTYTLPDPNFALAQAKVWHRVFANAYGSFIQNIFTLSDTQIRDLDIATSDITIQGLIYYMTPCGRISYDL